jgi:hypothetical protein
MKKIIIIASILFSKFSFSQLSTNGDVLKFNQISDYKNYTEDLSLMNSINTFTYANNSITSLLELNNSNNNIPDFIKSILNQDYFVQIGTNILRFDLSNELMFVVDENANNPLKALLDADINSNDVYVFSSDIDNGVEILEKIESGELTLINYKNSLNANTKRCTGAKERKDAYLENWDDMGTTDCSGTKHFSTDEKLTYQRFIIFFQIKAKLQSLSKCNDYADAGSAPNYDAYIKIVGNLIYNRRCDGNITVNVDTDVNPSNKLTWDPYRSWRSLHSYDCNVQFSISHSIPNALPVLFNCIPLHIQY